MFLPGYSLSRFFHDKETSRILRIKDLLWYKEDLPTRTENAIFDQFNTHAHKSQYLLLVNSEGEPFLFYIPQIIRL